MEKNIANINWSKDSGLVPAIIQDKTSKDILMLGYMNQESLTKTLETKLVTFFSRSKNRLWTKGETSGNYLQLMDWNIDCDQDTLIFSVIPKGPACHTGTKTCFGQNTFTDSTETPLLFFKQLQNTISDRLKDLDTQKSYIAKLVSSGEDRIIQKVGEEAVEVVISAKNTDLEDLKGEAADLIFHLMVLLQSKGLSLEDIATTLKSRHQ